MRYHILALNLTATQQQPHKCCAPTGAALAVALPLTVEAVVIYLSIILAGCVVVCIADSFAAHEVDTRLRISGAVGIFTQVGVRVELGGWLVGWLVDCWFQWVVRGAGVLRQDNNSNNVPCSCVCLLLVVITPAGAVTSATFAAVAVAAEQDVVLRGGKALPLFGRLLDARHLPPAIVLQVNTLILFCRRQHACNLDKFSKKHFKILLTEPTNLYI